ncbi:SigE family RNA polymerase sigma factor [Planotetraspora sp. A-T 1434]|uniref:SigE family RNA polymerase sigma factor n=1 Tax=Planotetraspora sp. A-T 1434 TaxID=2979219 RepID=UPI0021BFC74F|nr:SigE family RNA polymerase sigma factor [Planotetraspora sp. A-T 1434]MCT9934819.1 SigE family RNA polymerase sigma factor [Planotetraspora sp. A-T 1434]
MDRNDSFREFVAAHQQSLMRTAYLLTGDAHLAEDLLQTVLLKVLGRWFKLSRIDSPEAYARKALLNQHISWRRRRAGAELPSTAPPERVYSSEDSTVVRLVMRQALMRLPPRQRAVIVLRFYEDRTERETAELLNCSIGTVKSQVHHALARLRDLAPHLAPKFAELDDIREAHG